MIGSELKGKEQLGFENPQSFSDNGLVIVREVLDQDEIATIRKRGYQDILRLGDARHLEPRHVLAEPEMYLLPFKKKILIMMKFFLQWSKL